MMLMRLLMSELRIESCSTFHVACAKERSTAVSRSIEPLPLSNFAYALLDLTALHVGAILKSAAIKIGSCQPML